MINEKFLQKAVEKVADPRVLVIMASRRSRQLSRGAKPMVKTLEPEHMNIALLEIGEGLMSMEKEKKQI